MSDPVGKHRPGLRVSRRHRGHPGHPEAADGIEQPQQLGVVGPEAPNLDTASDWNLYSSCGRAAAASDWLRRGRPRGKPPTSYQDVHGNTGPIKAVF